MQVLRTRLYPPALNEGLVLRQKLLSDLLRNNHVPLTLVVAGAGYGKSILVSQWLNASKKKSCWISLEEDCNDIRIALSYFVAAIKSVFPSSFKYLDDTINAIESPSADSIIKLVINELTVLPEDLTIVLDNFHLMNNEIFNQILNDLLKNPPDHVHLVIISRHDPLIRLNTLRSYNRIHELRMADLRFSESDVNKLAQHTYKLSLNASQIDRIIQLTEGWVLGLHAIFKNLVSGTDFEESINAVSESKSYFTGFLLGEVTTDQSKAKQISLLLASYFERFCTDLIFELLNIEQVDLAKSISREDLQDLFENSLFIIPLDDENKWFRFHHLIQESLQKNAILEFTENQVFKIYEGGSSFFESKELIDEAIVYAGKGTCFQKAADIITVNKQKALNQDRYKDLRIWLELLPFGWVEKEPSLLLARSILHETIAEFTRMDDDLKLAATLLEPYDESMDSSRILWGEFHALRAGWCYYMGEVEKAVEYSERSLEMLKVEPSLYIRHYVLYIHSFCLHFQGKESKAEKIIKSEIKSVEPGNRLSLVKLLSVYNILLLREARYSELQSSAEAALQISRDEKLFNSHNIAMYALIIQHYVQNHIEQIGDLSNASLEQSYSGRPYWVLNILSVYALASLKSGDQSALDNILLRMYGFANQFENRKYISMVQVFEVELALRLHNVEKAVKLSLTADFNPYPPLYYYFIPQLTEVKLYMTSGDTAQLDVSKEMLDGYLHLSKKINYPVLHIQILALYAVWHYRNADIQKAVENLREAISYAQKGNLVRTFVDMGEEMHLVFENLTLEEKRSPFVRKILNLMKYEEDMAHFEQSHKDKKPTTELTEKEKNILCLIMKGYRNKEIAEELFFSESTIKSYIYLIYKKLGVKNRVAAINKAHGVLKPNEKVS